MKQKILIIDAHPVYATKMEGFLKGLTFQDIVVSQTGEDGIQVAGKASVDFVILSGMLPDMSSLDVCRKIKSINPDTAIIVQVGLFSSNDLILEFQQSGADFILDRKEKDLRPLEEAIGKILSKSVIKD